MINVRRQENFEPETLVLTSPSKTKARRLTKSEPVPSLLLGSGVFIKSYVLYSILQVISDHNIAAIFQEIQSENGADAITTQNELDKADKSARIIPKGDI